MPHLNREPKLLKKGELKTLKHPTKSLSIVQVYKSRMWRAVDIYMEEHLRLRVTYTYKDKTIYLPTYPGTTCLCKTINNFWNVT